jgi:hypothetical protein
VGVCRRFGRIESVTERDPLRRNFKFVNFLSTSTGSVGTDHPHQHYISFRTPLKFHTCSGSSFAVVLLLFSLQNDRPFPVRHIVWRLGEQFFFSSFFYILSVVFLFIFRF